MIINTSINYQRSIINFFELLPRVELGTSSLPRMRSTTELKQQVLSGKRDSNPRPPAWKASALSTELFPQLPEHKVLHCHYTKKFSFSPQDLARIPLIPFWGLVGSDGFEPPKRLRSRFTVCPIWPLWKLPKFSIYNLSVCLEPLVGFEPTTPRLQITCSGQLS